MFNDVAVPGQDVAPLAEPAPSPADLRLQAWEGEGGAVQSPGPGAGPAAPDEGRQPRSHRFGEGQQARTITQDEQDRLAARR